MRFFIALTVSVAIHAAVLFGGGPADPQMIPITGPSDVLQVTIGKNEGVGYTQSDLLLEQQSDLVPLSELTDDINKMTKVCKHPPAI